MATCLKRYRAGRSPADVRRPGATRRHRMSTDTSVPGPRLTDLGASDSALLGTLLREAPIGFAFFDTDLRFQRVNSTLARLHGLDTDDHLGRRPSEVWPADLAARSEAALHRVLTDDQPVLEADQPVIAAPGQPQPGRGQTV